MRSSGFVLASFITLSHPGPAAAGNPNYLAPKPLPPVQQMEVLKELAGLNPKQYATLLSMRNDPAAARSFVLSLLEERLAGAKALYMNTTGMQQVDHLEAIFLAENAIKFVKGWSPRVKRDRLVEFRKAINEKKQNEPSFLTNPS